MARETKAHKTNDIPASTLFGQQLTREEACKKAWLTDGAKIFDTLKTSYDHSPNESQYSLQMPCKLTHTLFRQSTIFGSSFKQCMCTDYYLQQLEKLGYNTKYDNDRCILTVKNPNYFPYQSKFDAL